MDNSWNFRSAFDSARQLKRKQDAFCRKALDVHSKGQALKDEDAEFPDDLKMEALVDVLRGKVLVNTHCYGKLAPLRYFLIWDRMLISFGLGYRND